MIHATAARQRRVRDGRRRIRQVGSWCFAGVRPLLSLIVVSGLALGGLACSGADEGKLPPEVPDPETLHTSTGAMARYRGTLALVPGVLEPLMVLTGILTDELADLPTPPNVGGAYTSLDSRRDLGGFGGSYADLH